MRSWPALIAFACLIVALAACAPAEEPADQEEGVTEAAGSGEEEEHVDGAEAMADIPSREGEVARDEYSKPDELYDFVGIGEGDHVVDLLAGNGYNTYLLAQRVGVSGRIYAEKGSDGLRARVERGDLHGADVAFIVDPSELPTGEIDVVMAVRAYHLFPDVPATLAELYRALKPGGVVGIVEVRLNQPRGHDITTHRMGEETVIEDMTVAGFELEGQLDILRRDDDDYTTYQLPDGTRYTTDRMLLTFRKPGDAPD